jgi:hypothetical protein
MRFEGRNAVKAKITISRNLMSFRTEVPMIRGNGCFYLSTLKMTQKFPPKKIDSGTTIL